MYIRASRSGDRVYLRLVEAYRDEQGRIRQRQIAQLGRADQLAGEKTEQLIASLRRLTGAAPEAPGTPQFEPAREVGTPWLLTEIWHQLGLDQALGRALRSSRRRFDAEGAVRAMVFNRLCDPESKLGVLRWLEGVVLPGVETSELTHQQLLRAMDALIEERPRVEQAVGGLLRPLIDQELSVVFYDLTTIRVHGEVQVPEDLRHYGRSKDVKGAARQCVLGLIQSADGLPLDFELFEGNIAEVRTLLPMIERVLARFPIRRVVLVADRGLLSLDNVEQIEALAQEADRRLEYILAVPAGRYRDFVKPIAKMAFDAEVPSVCESPFDGRRLVVAHDPKAAAEQSARRREKLQELTDLGDQLAAKLDDQDAGKRSRGRRASDRGAYSRFQSAVLEAHFSRFLQADLQAERFSYSVDETALARAEGLDGKLVLLTNVSDLDPEEIVARYKALADIERGFRVLKSEIEIAPVYHRLPDRLRAHAMLCFLALLLHRVLRMRLRAGSPGLSVERALESLKSIQYHRLSVDGRRLSGLTRLTPEQCSLFEHLEVERPREAAL